MSLTKYSFMILVIANTRAFLGLRKHISKLTDLAAVTHFAGIDSFYRTVKLQKIGKYPRESERPSKRIRVKKALCYNIFNSQLFAIKGEEPLNVDDPGTQIDLGNHYPEIFRSIFSVIGSGELPYWLSARDVLYVNQYRLRPVYLEGISMTTYTEYVFTCPVWAHTARTIRQYFVSEEYNVNLVAAHRPIAGRFVFLPDPTSGHLKIEALAEESAVGSALINETVAETYYAKQRRKDGRTDTRALDPVCRLSPENKVRLCASVFASELMRDRYLFLPYPENVVHEKCRRQIISLDVNEPLALKYFRKMIGAAIKKNRIYDEWVIGCRVLSVRETTRDGDRTSSVYYVSRGDLKNSVFGYESKFGDARVFVDSYFNNVSVVARVHRDLEYKEEEMPSETASEASESFSGPQFTWSHSGPL